MVKVERIEKINTDMKPMGHTMKKKILVMNVIDDATIEKEEIVMGDTVKIDITNQRTTSVTQETKEVHIEM